MINVGILSVKRWDAALLDKLNNCSDLNHLPGNNWQYRRMNGDYGYVVLETEDFYTRSLVEFTCIKLEDNTSSWSDIGFSLVFCFVCNYDMFDTVGKNKYIHTVF